MTTALITGGTGQDGALLAETLLARGYRVHALQRRASAANTGRVAHLCAHDRNGRGLVLHYGDMTDSAGLIHVMKAVQPDEVYNLAGQSEVQVSFETPEYTANVDGLGTLRLLEAIRILGLAETVRFYQASTSELFGNAPPPQNEATPFRPCSPYATAKLYAYWTVVNYREAHGLHASNGILFNHEGPTRGEGFVTRKISRAVARIEAGVQDRVCLGNLDARRDWGHARDYAEGIRRIVRQDTPGDYVLATGQSHSVREFVETAFAQIGRGIAWAGRGAGEKGYDAANGRLLVEVDPQLFRPTEVDHLCGDARKARTVLGWSPTVGFAALVREMVEADRAALRRGHNGSGEEA